jgi:dual-specificity kinase
MYKRKRNRSVTDRRHHYKRRYRDIHDRRNHHHRRGSSWSSHSSVSDTGTPPPPRSLSGSECSRETSKDEIIHFDWYRGLYLSKRYEVCRKLGDGTFGRVLECVDRLDRDGPRVAVKVIRDVERYVENAKVEAKILERINNIRREFAGKHPGGRGIVRLYDVFTHGRFFCMSFERLGKTLYEVIQMNNHVGFYMFDIQVIAKELLETLDFLHSVCGLIHTDIKMENVMLTGYDFISCSAPARCGKEGSFNRPVLLSVQTRHRSVRLIDFGNGVFSRDHHSTIINTRQYRSPEVILEQGWDEKSDMWSVACVIAEMYTGELLFPTHANAEHLAMIERVSDEVFTPEYFSHSPRDVRQTYQNAVSGYLDWPNANSTRESLRAVQEDCFPLSRIFHRYPALYELMSKLIRIDPSRRYSARKCLDYCMFVCGRTLPITE